MKKVFCLLTVFILILCGCTKPTRAEKSDVFTKNDNGDLVNELGTEYTYLANESVLHYFGELEFVGGVKGEDKISKHLDIPYQTGMFAIKNSDNDILIRHIPDNEWASIYRKSSLPKFDYSLNNCIRLEFVLYADDSKENTTHTTCQGGITDTTVIAEFLSDVRSQDTPDEAKLYDLVTKPNGELENCYTYGAIYGFFESEPNLAIQMNITSYDHLAYSISIEDNEYVLPKTWLKKIKSSSCTK